MSNEVRRFAVLTGGGDCPGLNAVICAVTRCLWEHGAEVYGVYNGFKGLVEDHMKKMEMDDVSGIIPKGGTILGTTNRDNPFKYAEEHEDGSLTYSDRSQDVVDNLKKHDIEGLIVIGGDGTLNIAGNLAKKKGINVVGCPKTIDNDLACTERTFGFDTAVSVATEAIDRIHTTAESHHRVMALEVMGRDAGWIALHSGIAGGADVILIPEIPYTMDSILKKIAARKKVGKHYTIIVVAEGAKPLGGDRTIARIVKGSFEPVRLGGVSVKLVTEIEEKTGIESRCTILGYIQRGGTPTGFDRILCIRYGVAAAEACLARNYNTMASLNNDKVHMVDIQLAANGFHGVPLDSELIHAAREIGICFGD